MTSYFGAEQILVLFGAPLVDASPDLPEPGGLLSGLHRTNGELWSCLDDLRQDGLSDGDAVALQREVDVLNLARSDLVTRITADYDRAIGQSQTAPLATEGVGQAIDRLSVLELRLTHTERRSVMDPSLRDRLRRLAEQRRELAVAIDLLIDDAAAGRRRFPVYDAAKLYGSK